MFSRPKVWKYLFLGLSVFFLAFDISIIYTLISIFLFHRYEQPYLLSLQLLPIDILLAIFVSLGLFRLKNLDKVLSGWLWVLIFIFGLIVILPGLLFLVNDFSIVFLGQALTN